MYLGFKVVPKIHQLLGEELNIYCTILWQCTWSLYWQWTPYWLQHWLLPILFLWFHTFYEILICAMTFLHTSL